MNITQNLHCSLEDLSTCIEHCTIINDRVESKISNSEFYYDTRLGMRIDEHLMHPVYKNNIRINVLPVISVCSITRKEYVFDITLLVYENATNIADTNAQKVTISVRYFPIDHSFVVRSYDPTKIIQAILSNNDNKDFFVSHNHPYHKYGYIADYGWAPENLTIMYNTMQRVMPCSNTSNTIQFNEKNTLSRPILTRKDELEYDELTYEDDNKYDKQTAVFEEDNAPKRFMFRDELDESFLHDSDEESDPSKEIWTRVQEPDSNSETSEREESDDGIISADDDGVISADDEMTMEELKELEDLFGSNDKHDISDTDDGLTFKKKVKKLPTRKINIHKSQNHNRTDDNKLQKSKVEHEFMNDILMSMTDKKQNKIIYNNLLDMSDYKAVFSQKTPKLKERDDNL